MESGSLLTESLRLHQKSVKRHADSLKHYEKSLRLHKESLDLQERSSRLRNEASTVNPAGTSASQVSSESHANGLCERCAQIPFGKIFGEDSRRDSKRHRIGTLSHSIATQDVCQFCLFLVQGCELAFNRELNGDSASDLCGLLGSGNLYLISHTADKPWYMIAGIMADLTAAPSAWLRLGSSTKPIEPYVCISRHPESLLSEDTGEDKFLPRLRSATHQSTGMVDYDLVNSWLQVCHNEHHSLCVSHQSLDTEKVRLLVIDVHSRTVEEMKHATRYIALSYVWGRQSRDCHSRSMWPRSTDATIAESFMPISLPAQMPQTIKDAILFVKTIGERYLWVDTCCIDPRNEREKNLQFENMGLIYQGAYLTIIALDGESSSAGLSGISRPLDQTSQPLVTTQHGQFMATYVDSIWDHVGASPWDYRAWTMQEGVLSWRCIIFGQKHITFRCQEEYFHDTMVVDMEKNRVPTVQSTEFFWDNVYGIDLNQETWNLTTWDALIAVYSRRQLTWTNDVLNACKGALNQITRNTGVSFTYGMPQADFLRALLWKPHHQHTLVRRPDFPSWSWTGWIGPTECSYWVGDMDFYAEQRINEGNRARKRRRVMRKLSSLFGGQNGDLVSNGRLTSSITLI